MLKVVVSASLFWAYFHLYSARWSYHGTKPTMQFDVPLLGPRATWYALVALVPLVAIWSDIEPGRNPFLASAALTVTIDPLLPRAPSGLASAHRPVRWLLGEGCRWLLVAVLSSVLLAISGVIDISALLAAVPSWGSPTSEALPRGFLLSAIFMILWRAGATTLVEAPLAARGTRCVLALALGYGALGYFSEILTRTEFDAGNWEAPVAGGFVVGLFAKYLIARHIEANDHLES